MSASVSSLMDPIAATPSTTLPPRKRAKTQAEKEQRRVERILRNRRAAHASREKKRKHVEFLEAYTVDLEHNISVLQQDLLEALALLPRHTRAQFVESPLRNTTELRDKIHSNMQSQPDRDDEDDDQSDAPSSDQPEINLSFTSHQRKRLRKQEPTSSSSFGQPQQDPYNYLSPVSMILSSTSPEETSLYTTMQDLSNPEHFQSPLSTEYQLSGEIPPPHLSQNLFVKSEYPEGDLYYQDQPAHLTYGLERGDVFDGGIEPQISPLPVASAANSLILNMESPTTTNFGFGLLGQNSAAILYSKLMARNEMYQAATQNSAINPPTHVLTGTPGFC